MFHNSKLTQLLYLLLFNRKATIYLWFDPTILLSCVSRLLLNWIKFNQRLTSYTNISLNRIEMNLDSHTFTFLLLKYVITSPKATALETAAATTIKIILIRYSWPKEYSRQTHIFDCIALRGNLHFMRSYIHTKVWIRCMGTIFVWVDWSIVSNLNLSTNLDHFRWDFVVYFFSRKKICVFFGWRRKCSVNLYRMSSNFRWMCEFGFVLLSYMNKTSRIRILKPHKKWSRWPSPRYNLVLFYEYVVALPGNI